MKKLIGLDINRTFQHKELFRRSDIKEMLNKILKNYNSNAKIVDNLYLEKNIYN